MSYALETRNLSYFYPRKKTPVLSDVNLQIERGEFILLLGPSGCGKSTLTLCFNGLIPKLLLGRRLGRVFVNGNDIDEHEVFELAAELGIVFQDPEAQLFNLVVEDEVAFTPESLMLPPSEIKKRVVKYLDLVGMSDKRLDYTFALSGGEKQRAALASVLAAEPEILILDEPTSNLDPRGTRDFLDVVYRLASDRELTIVAVEHQVEHLADLADRVLVMDSGAIVADGSPREIFADRELCDSLGVWTPQVTRLAVSLQEEHITFKELPLTIHEVIDGFRQHNLTYESRELEFRAGREYQEDAKSPLIEIQNLSYTYPDGPKALKEINCVVHPGEFVAVVGANGSGKSTMMKHLVGLIKAQDGSVLIDGEDILNSEIETITRKVGYVFQYPEHQFVTQRVFDEIAYSLRARDVDEHEVIQRVHGALKLFGLEEFEDQHPFTLSMGQKRRLSVATMTVIDQKAIILDEPTMGQDWRQTKALLGLLKTLNEKSGKTIFVVTHDMQVVARWAQRVLVLDGGRLILDSSPRELFGSEEILQKTALLRPQIATLTRQLNQAIAWPELAITNEEFANGVSRPKLKHRE